MVDSSAARAALEQEQSQLSDELADLQDAKFDDNFADSGQVAAEQGETRALAGSLRDQLDDVEAALARLDDGTYGTCEVCGEAIAEARLEAIPAARTCIDHA